MKILKKLLVRIILLILTVGIVCGSVQYHPDHYGRPVPDYAADLYPAACHLQ